MAIRLNDRKRPSRGPERSNRRAASEAIDGISRYERLEVQKDKMHENPYTHPESIDYAWVYDVSGCSNRPARVDTRHLIQPSERPTPTDSNHPPSLPRCPRPVSRISPSTPVFLRRAVVGGRRSSTPESTFRRLPHPRRTDQWVYPTLDPTFVGRRRHPSTPVSTSASPVPESQTSFRPISSHTHAGVASSSLDESASAGSNSYLRRFARAKRVSRSQFECDT